MNKKTFSPVVVKADVEAVREILKEHLE